jgi:hypothetical protein
MPGKSWFRNDVRQAQLAPYAAEKVRQGPIVLCHPWQIWFFVAGLAGCIILLLGAILFSSITP